MMSSPKSLSVIIPAHNEERRISAYLSEIITYLERQEYAVEIIVVDDGSTDSTANVVEEFKTSHQDLNLIRLSHNRGKGFAVKTGMLAAGGNLKLFVDADGATPITELERLLRFIENDGDVAIASRALYDVSCTLQAHLHRKVIGTIYNCLVKLFLRLEFQDTQCGFKLFTAAAADAVFPYQTIHDFGFDPEILFLCKYKGFYVKEIAVSWRDVPGSKVDLLRDSIRMLLGILKIRVNHVTGRYGKVTSV